MKNNRNPALGFIFITLLMDITGLELTVLFCPTYKHLDTWKFQRSLVVQWLADVSFFEKI